MSTATATSYFWIYGKTRKDKSVLIGPYWDEGRASRIAEKLEDSQLFHLPTKNQTKATRIVKARLGEATGRFGDHVKNFQHGPQDTLIQELQSE